MKLNPTVSILFYRNEKKQQGCPMGAYCCKNKKAEEAKNAETAVKSKYVPDHDSQEPIFPTELKTIGEEVGLTLKGPRATWYRPHTLADFMKIRAENSNSKVITGNTECGVETKFRGWLYPVLISPVAIPELNQIEITAENMKIGASVTLNEIDNHLV